MEPQKTVVHQIRDGAAVEVVVTLPESRPFPNEGKTVAAWTLTWVASIGAAVVGVGMVLSMMLLVWIGIGVVVLGLVASGVLRVIGLGQPRDKGGERRTRAG